MPPRKPKVKKATAPKTTVARDRPAAVALPGAAKPSAPAAVAAPPVKAPAAPPPRLPATPAKETYKALYNFAGQAGEMNLTKGEHVEVKQKDDNGKSTSSKANCRLVDGNQERPRRMGPEQLSQTGRDGTSAAAARRAPTASARCAAPARLV